MLSISKRIPKWVISKHPFSSISTTPNPHTSVFYKKIQFLRNKPYADALIKVLHNTHDVNSALNIFKWASLQRGFKHNANTYYLMALKLGMAGNIKEMEGICQNMVNDKCPGVESALVSLIDYFIRNSRVSEAMCVVGSVNSGGFRLSIDVFNLLMGGVVKEKRGFKDGVFVYKEMVKAGLVPNLTTLNCLLEVLFESGRVESALDQYRRMHKKGCSPNSRTFEIMMKGLVACDQVDEAVNILDEMFGLGVSPEMSFYTCIIPLFCRENKVEEAIRLFRMTKASGIVPDLLICESLIRCLCNNLRLDDAERLLEEMMQNFSTPTGSVFVHILNGFCNLGKINKAVRFLEDKNIVNTSAYNAILCACCDSDRFFQAKYLLDKMVQKNLADCDSWNILIRWLCEKGMIKKAYEVLGRMLLSYLCPNSATYLAFIVASCRSNNHQEAQKLFYQLKANCWDLDSASFSELIEGLCGFEKYLEAAKLLVDFSGNNFCLENSVFNKVIQGICETREVNKAIRLRFVAAKSGTSCSTATSNDILSELVKLDQGRNTMIFFSQMLVDGCNLNKETYCILIHGMIRQNKAKDCAQLFTRMVDDDLVPDSDTLYDLLSFFTNQCQLSLIAATIDKLVLDCEALDLATNNMVLVVRSLWKQGNKTKAHQLLNFMLDKGWLPEVAVQGLLSGTKEEGEKTEVYECSIVGDNVCGLAEGSQ